MRKKQAPTEVLSSSEKKIYLQWKVWNSHKIKD